MWGTQLIRLALTGIGGLWMIESVDSIKLASQLNKQWELEDRDEKLNIMLQINTSHEEGNSVVAVLNCIHTFYRQVRLSTRGEF